jgi:DNA-binding NarL/FixJ family response regulator
VIRVAVVDDHTIVRNGLVALLGAHADLEIVGAVGDGEAAVALCVEQRPDVVLMDLSMPGVGGIEATRRIAAEAPGVQVVVLTSFMDRERIVEALSAGAIGYLLKDAEPEELIRGIHTAARGESPLDPRAARTMLEPSALPTRWMSSRIANARCSCSWRRACRTSRSDAGSRSARRPSRPT